MAKALTRLLLGVLIGCSLGVAGVVFSVWYVARQDDRQSADTIVVLGSAQYNGVPSANFKARLQHALDLYDEGWATHIVTVGGNRAGDNYTEAGAGRTWLIGQGAPADAVIAVETGSNTLQSAIAVGKLCAQKKWTTAIVVTDPWHTLRSEQMIGEQGIITYGSPTRSGPSVQTRSTQIRYIIRESAAILYYGVTGNNSDGAQEHG